MKRSSTLEIFEAAEITKSEYSNDYSALGVSLTDSAILKLANYTGELPPDLKNHLDYKLPFVQARAETLKQREAEKRQREAEDKQRQAERQAQASADLDHRLIAKLKGANPSVTDAEVKELLPELRKRHILAEIKRRDEANARVARGL